MEQSTGFVVKRVEMENHAAARFNDLLCIRSQIVELKRASVVFYQQIINENEQRLVSAKIQVACVDLNKMRPIAIPDAILGEFSRVI